LTAYIILDPAQFLRIIAPRHDVAMAADGGQPIGMGFVEIAVDPFFVYGV